MFDGNIISTCSEYFLFYLWPLLIDAKGADFEIAYIRSTYILIIYIRSICDNDIYVRGAYIRV